MRTLSGIPSGHQPGYPGLLSPNDRLKGAGATAAILLLFIVSVASGPAALYPTLLQECPAIEASSCFTNPAIDLAVVLDRSGSLSAETYNVQIRGLAIALRDPSVIPRDGSVAISVITFSEQASIEIPLMAINSAAKAEQLAKAVESLQCLGGENCPARGDQPASNFNAAINKASLQLRRTQNQDGKRRVLLLSTDGGCTDPDCGQGAAAAFRECGGTPSQFEVVLLGSDQINNITLVKANRLVALGSCPDHPGAVRTINPKGCAGGQSRCDAPARFAANLRCVLRSQVQPLALKVTRTSDEVAGTTAEADGLTLRQAIEMANAHGGEATITFDLNGGQNDSVITLNAPLPPICAPGITVDGCAASGGFTEGPEPSCAPAITIDGRNRFCDGLFIRSNRARIHGLKVENFSRAGITVAPLSPADAVGFNRIEGNWLENNSEAGVLVLDPAPNPANAVFHNERNTIVGNSIMGSMTPIDLAGDGPTGNDDDDADQGPNTLLNFPLIASVEGSTARAIIKGSLCSAAAGGASGDCLAKLPARVDVFAVTGFRPAVPGVSAASVKASDGGEMCPDSRSIVSVEFFTSTDVGPDGAFEVEVGESPTYGYALTATDREGNTSEVSFPCRGFAKVLTGTDQLAFSEVGAGSAATEKTLTVQNVGCDCLRLRHALVARSDSQNGRITSLEDSAHFLPTGSGMDIFPGRQETLRILFKPDLPRAITQKKEKKNGLLAADVLPGQVDDRLTLQYDSGESRIRLIGRVRPEIKLIDPKQPQRSPLIVLRRSGDSFFVEFSIYDSDLEDVDRALIEFFDAAHGNVPVDNGEVKLKNAIHSRGLVPGQSFKVIQEFVNAKQHPETGSVRVQVFGSLSNSSDTGEANLSGLASAVSLSRKWSPRRTGPRPAPLKRGMARLKIDD